MFIKLNVCYVVCLFRQHRLHLHANAHRCTYSTRAHERSPYTRADMYGKMFEHIRRILIPCLGKSTNPCPRQQFDWFVFLVCRQLRYATPSGSLDFTESGLGPQWLTTAASFFTNNFRFLAQPPGQVIIFEGFNSPKYGGAPETQLPGRSQ